MGDAERAALVAVGQVEPEVGAVGEQLDDVADALAADDDHDLADAHAGQRLERVVDHRPVVDRQEVLVGDDRQREEAGRGAAGEDDAFHRGTAYQRRSGISGSPAASSGRVARSRLGRGVHAGLLAFGQGPAGRARDRLLVDRRQATAGSR